MLKRNTRVAGVALLCAIALGCEKSSPTRPSGGDTVSAAPASVTDARTGATIIAARPQSPADKADIPWSQQPITLTVTNGVTTGSSALTYTFEVATDAGFGSIVWTKGGVAPGGGTTSIALDKLGGSKTYYWRARADIGGGTGPNSAVRSFNVGPEVVLGTPVLASPVNNTRSFIPLTLVVNNVSRSGPAGPIVYTVQVSRDANFGSFVYSNDVQEQPGSQTNVSVPATGLTDGATYYWRVMATDTTNKIATPFSGTASFIAQSFNFATAKMWDSPPDLASWPETTRITSIEFTGFSMRVDFDRRQGPNAWPDQVPPGFSGGLQYTLGMCRFLEGNWNCAGIVEFWSGRSIDDTAPPSEFWREWWYQPQRWGPLALHPPQEGDIVGVFVGSGDLRGRTWTRQSCPQICERSNVAFVPFTTGYAFNQF